MPTSYTTLFPVHVSPNILRQILLKIGEYVEEMVANINEDHNMCILMSIHDMCIFMCNLILLFL